MFGGDSGKCVGAEFRRQALPSLTGSGQGWTRLKSRADITWMETSAHFTIGTVGEGGRTMVRLYCVPVSMNEGDRWL